MTLRRIFSNSLDSGAIDSSKIASGSINDSKIFKLDIPRITNVTVTTPDFTPVANSNICFRNDPGYCLITGTNLLSGCQVFLEKITFGQASNLTDFFTLADSITYNDTTNIFAVFNTLSAGYYNLYVVNPDSGVGLKINTFGVSIDPPIEIEFLSVAGGGGGGGTDLTVLGQGGAGGAGIYGSFLLPVDTSFTVGIGGGGGGGDTNASGLSGVPSGGSGGTLGGGSGGNAGEVGTSGGGGGGGGYSSFSGPLGTYFVIGGGGGGGGADEGNANNVIVRGGGIAPAGTTGSTQGGNGGNFGVTNGGGYGGGGGGFVGGVAGTDIYGAQGGTNYAESSFFTNVVTLTGANVAALANIAANSATFPSGVVSAFNYYNGKYGNGGQAATDGSSGVLILKYKGLKRMATGGIVTRFNGNTYHTFSNAGTEIFTTGII